MSESVHELSSHPNEPPAAAAHSTAAEDNLLAALADDFAKRVRRQERPVVEEYAAKHPELADRIRKLFPTIALMEESRTIDAAATTGSQRPGSIIGRYKLLERIGEGGFGVVYMAEQQHPVRRKVALKVVKPGMDSRQVLARFDAERQALAIMDHPNIAKVFDAGVTDLGRPYFVMELIKGEPIIEFCDRNQFSPHERLELFTQVCHAVQHAHQKGIIHRDIKPTNVLVEMHDTTPVVKVIDFGVAKALGQELTDKTVFTGFAQFLGTPLYMSPEQAGQSSLDIDTRSDIYSLGVLLYELLTGTTPFDKERFQKAAHDEICRIIREEEPPKPSTRLSASKDSLASISAQRHTEPAKLTKLVRGELDWIVMKALEKDRTRRYEAASGLARDIERYLHDEPVEACPPLALYRFKKLVRRNRAKLVTASVIGAALLVAVGMFGWAVRDRSARQARVAGQVELIMNDVDDFQDQQKWPEALSAARRAEAVVSSGDADSATVRRVRAQLKDLKFIDRLEKIRMQGLPSSEGKADFASGDREYARAFRDYGVDVDELPVEESIERLKAPPAFAIAVAVALDEWLTRRYQASKADAPGLKRLVAVADGIDPEPLRHRLRATWGKPDSEVLDELLRLAESIDIPAHHPVTLNDLAQRLSIANQPIAALQLLQDARKVYPGDFWLNTNLAYALYKRNDNESAERFYTAAVALRPSAASAHSRLGRTQHRRGKLDEAITAFRRAIEIDPREVLAYSNLGVALYAQGKRDEAIAAYHKAIEIDPKFSVPHLNIAWCLTTCSDLKFRDTDLALSHAKKSVELDPTNPFSFNSLGVAHYRNGDYRAAIAALERSMELRKGGISDGEFFLAMSHWQLGNKDEARRCYEKAVQKMGEPPGPHDAISDEERNRIRAEAAELLGVNEKKEGEPSSAPSQ